MSHHHWHGGVRALIAHLTINHHYDVALRVVNLTCEAFSIMPAIVDQLHEDECVIERLSLNEKMKPLHDLIDGLDSDLRPLNDALGKNGFGQSANQPAKGLWEVFLQTVKVTDLRKEADRPWMVMRDLALRLSHRAEFASGASALFVGLIQYGEEAFVTSEVLDRLRDDLRSIKRKNQMEATDRNTGINRSPRLLAGASELILKQPSEQQRKQIFSASFHVTLSNKRRVWLLVLALSGMLCALLPLLGTIKLSPLWSNTALSLPTEKDPIVFGQEIMPPARKGEHFSQGNVRYCRFQEERLRMIKEEVHGPEDVRAFNLLANDYNSRCSDFFYQESDLAVVTAEVNANRVLLEADAKRIASTWPGHGPSGAAVLQRK